jgi:hypothetical protein
MLSNSKFNKFIQQIPLRDAQRDSSAGPVSIKGQAFGLAFYADTRAHSVFLRAMALHSTCWGVSMKWEGFGTMGSVVRPSSTVSNRPPITKSRGKKCLWYAAPVRIAKMSVLKYSEL